jgi:hypothetical protein
MTHRTMFVAAAVAAALASSAYAQQTTKPQPINPGTPTQSQSGSSGQMAPSGSQMRADQVSERDIQQFASASAQVKQIKQKYHPQVTAAKDDQGKEKIERQAWAEMESAVQKSGLTVDKYNQIAQLAQSNPDVQRKVEAHTRR